MTTLVTGSTLSPRRHLDDPPCRRSPPLHHDADLSRDAVVFGHDCARRSAIGSAIAAPRTPPVLGIADHDRSARRTRLATATGRIAAPAAPFLPRGGFRR